LRLEAGRRPWGRRGDRARRARDADAQAAAARALAQLGRHAGVRLYDPPPVDFDLTDEQREIQRLARDFADQEVRPVAEELDREKRFPYEVVQKLGGLGLM